MIESSLILEKICEEFGICKKGEHLFMFVIDRDLFFTGKLKRDENRVKAELISKVKRMIFTHIDK